ncbi:hypothetical protein AM586_06110 [Massilia sp. WG5]|nr:hypothetical protein AM586_06110 [Massilia sp. WG5]
MTVACAGLMEAKTAASATASEAQVFFMVFYEQDIAVEEHENARSSCADISGRPGGILSNLLHRS